MKSILILTAGLGGGHDVAAGGICEALEQTAPEAEIVVADLFAGTYHRVSPISQRACMGSAAEAQSLWSSLIKLLSCTPWLADRDKRLRRGLVALLEATKPDCVVSTYPVYGQLIHGLFRDHCERPFRFLTMVTDVRSIDPGWYRWPGDCFVVADQEAANVLHCAGVQADKVRLLGFPVSPRFIANSSDPVRAAPKRGEPFRVLYLLEQRKKKARKAIDRLLEIPGVELTVTIGRHAALKAKLAKRARKQADRFHLLGWTNQLPELLKRSHLVIGRARNAAVQEAIAARCPILVTRAEPGPEEHNGRLIEQEGIGALAENDKQLARYVRAAMASDWDLWRQWRKRLEQLSRPEASLRIAELVLEECERANQCVRPEVFPVVHHNNNLMSARADTEQRHYPDGALLCDFHIHTNYSDGKLTVPEVIDFYGIRGFDCICITDHWTDPRRLIGKLQRLTPLTLSFDQIEEYFQVLEREAKRAWRRYGMLVLTGLEFNKDGPTKKSSAHVLGVDLKEPISPELDLLETIERIHAQGALAVAAHPHLMKSEWAKDTLYLWENQEQFIPVIDAWEIANRNNLFTPISLKRLPLLANSDFHKPKHIYSWKTLLHCAKDPETIKACIRRNERISITLYRDEHPARVHQAPESDKLIALNANVAGRAERLLPDHQPLPASSRPSEPRVMGR